MLDFFGKTIFLVSNTITAIIPGVVFERRNFKRRKKPIVVILEINTLYQINNL